MNLRSAVRCVLVVATMAAVVQEYAMAEESAKPLAPPAVLDTFSYWRSFVTFRPVVLAEKTEGAAVPKGRPRTAAPPDDWLFPDFDDCDWVRTAGPLFAGPDGFGWASGGGGREISVLYLRGKFAVVDPTKVQSLRFSATYRGGIVVYLNGTEVARSHMGKGSLTPDSLAEEYPWEAYVDADGRTPLEPQSRTRSDEQVRRLKLRLRRIEDVSIPTTNLRRGVNVLAIEVHRAPTHPQADKLRDAWKTTWSACGLCDIALTAEPQSAVQPNTQRPKGIQVWNESPLTDLYVHDYGDPNEPLRPIQLVGVRNGAFSGHVVVGSDSPIKGLAAEVSDLATGDGKGRIPAAAVRLLFPQPTGSGPTNAKSYRGLPGHSVRRFDALAESPPAEVAVAQVSVPRGYTGPAATPPGAVQPVRVTVQVPAAAAPGDYEGRLTLKAGGMEPVTVPVRIRVIGWTLPHPVDFTSIIGIVQSFETLALYYKVPLWSERHWQLIDRSFAILGRVGVDTLFLPLVMRNHHGKESLVRWVKQEDGGFSHDFSVFEKYVDTALKHIPRPQFVCLYAYDRRYRTWEREDRQDNPQRAEKAERLKTQGPPKVIVPLLDPKTGHVSEMEGPAYSEGTAPAFWKPVLNGCRERLLKRGVAAEAIIIGIVPDGTPGPETIDMFHEAAPWAKWMQVSHAPASAFRGTKTSSVDIVHAAGVYGGTRDLRDPSEIRYYGWKPYSQRTPFFGVFPRTGSPYIMVEKTGLPMHWLFQEAYLMTGLRGPTRIGGEFWPVALDKGAAHGKRTLGSAYSSNVPGLGQAVLSLLEPGPDGALSTLRLETLYEGSQEGEARVFIEKAMEYHKDKLSIGGRTPEETRAMLQDMLDERARMFLAYLPALEFYCASGWQARSEKLYRAAADVAACLNR